MLAVLNAQEDGLMRISGKSRTMDQLAGDASFPRFEDIKSRIDFTPYDVS